MAWMGVLGGGVVLALLGGAGCSRINPEEPVERTPQACCTWGDFELQNFKGCRIPTRDCRSSKGERYWMRGYVTCGPVDEAGCDGGRCCSYKPQYADDLAEPIENWKPPGFAEPTNNITPPEGSAAGGDAKKAAPAKAPAPEPATEAEDAKTEAPAPAGPDATTPQPPSDAPEPGRDTKAG